MDDEDSLSDRLNQKTITEGIDVAVIRLPHISNFTDFSVFELIDGVSLRYVTDKKELGDPDLILLPGTKNTMGDMEWLIEVAGRSNHPRGKNNESDWNLWRFPASWKGNA